MNMMAENLEKNKTYIPEDEERNEYINFAFKMLAMNKIDGIVPCSVRIIDGRKQIKVQDHGLKKLESLLGKKDSDDLRKAVKMYSDLKSALISLDNFFLRPDDIIIDLQHVFYDENDDSFLFVCVPGSGDDDCSTDNYSVFQKNLKVFTEELMMNVKPRSCEENDFLNYVYNSLTEERLEPDLLDIENYRMKKKKEKGRKGKSRYSLEDGYAGNNCLYVSESLQAGNAPGYNSESLQAGNAPGFVSESLNAGNKPGYASERSTGCMDLKLLSMNRSLSGDLEISLPEMESESISLGRSPSQDVTVNCSTVSLSHCLLYREDKKVFIEDLNSRNGTRIEKKLLEPGKKYELPDRCHLEIGGVRFRVRYL